MVTYPNQNKTLYGIVVAGGYGDNKTKDPTGSGGCKVICPEIHGPGVRVEHLAFSRVLAQGTQFGGTASNFAPENGSAVICEKVEGHGGTNHLLVKECVSNDINRDSTTPGNSVAIWPLVAAAIAFKTEIRIPPNVGSGPAGSRPPKEKGDTHSHELLKFLPSTGTMWPINGLKLPQNTNIATAVQAFGNVLTADLLGKLPGLNMSLGALFDFMPSQLKDELFKNVPPEIAGAINSMSKLLRSIEIVESGGFSTAAKVNPDVFFANAVNLLSDVRDLSSLTEIMQRLQYDKSLYGLDKLPPVDFVMSGGPFGNIPMQIDAFGNITSLLPEPAKKLIEAFLSLMNNKSGGFPGVFPNENMFGNSAAVLNEMFNRLPTEELKKAVEQMQKNVAPGTKQRRNNTEVLKTSMQAGTFALALLGKLS